MSIGAPERLVLASASAVRRRLLDAAGIAIMVDPAAIDEAAIKAAFRGEGGPRRRTAPRRLRRPRRHAWRRAIPARW